jgi:catalase
VCAVIISRRLGTVKGTNGVEFKVDDSFLTGSPLLYDGLYIVGGQEGNDYTLRKTIAFVSETYRHFKPIGASQDGAAIIQPLGIIGKPGVIIEHNPTSFANEFIAAMSKQRFWDRA